MGNVDGFARSVGRRGGREKRYTADFSYKFGGKLVVEDVKSTATRTKEYLRNRKFMRSKFGIEIQEV